MIQIEGGREVSRRPKGLISGEDYNRDASFLTSRIKKVIRLCASKWQNPGGEAGLAGQGHFYFNK